MLRPDRVANDAPNAQDRLGFLRIFAYVLPALPLAALGMPIVVHLPQYYASKEVGLGLAVTGVIFSVMAFCTDSTWGLIAGTAREWLASSPARLVALRTTGACVMMTLGTLILASALSSA